MRRINVKLLFFETNWLWHGVGYKICHDYFMSFKTAKLLYGFRLVAYYKLSWTETKYVYDLKQECYLFLSLFNGAF
jgi:hypothetical protein